MKVLIVNTSDCTGGAAVAAGRLATALRGCGVEASMLVMRKASSSPDVHLCGPRWRHGVHFLWERFCIWASNLFSRKNLFKVSIANAGTDITGSELFRSADVIHLHWINQGFLSLRAIRRILDSGKPVVWTMHDMWPATAICHHAYGCDRYRTECRHCPFLRFPSERDLSNQVFRRKLSAYAGRGIRFVAVSSWLAEKARRSVLAGDSLVRVVPNAISLSDFQPSDRAEARRELGIRAPYVIIFGAARIDDDIKGFRYLSGALRRITESGAIPAADIHLLLFGGIRDGRVLQSLSVPYTHLGYVNDVRRLARCYSASNCVVSSSLYETFGQTLIEAMACGCLPVAFNNSGQTDIIDHKRTGFLADYLSEVSLSDGILWALLRAEAGPAEVRRSVEERFSAAVVAQKYIELYRELLGS